MGNATPEPGQHNNDTQVTHHQSLLSINLRNYQL